LAEALFELKDIAKSFPGVRALDGVSFDLRRGEVHALLGENGAGKSTLVKIVCGIYRPDAGTIRIDGKPVEITGPTQAQALGISPVHQELHLEPYLSVAENIFLGRQPVGRFGMINQRRMNRDAAALLKRLGTDLDPESTVESLSVAQRQIIAIARAASTTARIIIFDEPTSSLTERETNLLFDMIGRLRGEGIGIIYISHRMEEIFRLCDRVTVLRDGRCVATKPVAETGMRDLIGMMIGRDISDLFRKAPAPIGGPVLQVQNLSKRGLLRDISFSVRRG
jgi:ABC-type sugar transport system ATPase subunit